MDTRLELCFEIERQERTEHIKLTSNQLKILRAAISEHKSKHVNYLDFSEFDYHTANDTLWNCHAKSLAKLVEYGLALYVHMGGYFLTPLAFEFMTDDLSDDIDSLQSDSKYRHICPKCNGTGHIRQYSHVSGGICFHCNGTGKRH